MKILYSDGCSLMAGAEHNSWRINPDTGYEECDTVWSAILHKNFFPDYSYMSRATTGSSNYSIARRVVKNVSELLKDNNAKDIIVCLMWTSMYRKDIRVTQEYNPNIHKNSLENNFITLLPTDTKSNLKKSPTGAIANNHTRKTFLEKNNLFAYSNSLYNNFNHPINYTFDSLTQIEYVNLFLKLHEIKNIQCFGFGDHFYYKNTNDPYEKDFYTDDILERIKQYKIYYVDKFPQEGFYEWAKGGHPLGPGLHPLHQAHQMWVRQLARDYNLG